MIESRAARTNEALRVVITGGSAGIGQSMVEGFASAGHHVLFSYLHSIANAQKLTERFANVSKARLDQGNIHSVSEFAAAVRQWSASNGGGGIDVLVNNAALGSATVKRYVDVHCNILCSGLSNGGPNGYSHILFPDEGDAVDDPPHASHRNDTETIDVSPSTYPPARNAGFANPNSNGTSLAQANGMLHASNGLHLEKENNPSHRMNGEDNNPMYKILRRAAEDEALMRVNALGPLWVTEALMSLLRDATCPSQCSSRSHATIIFIGSVGGGSSAVFPEYRPSDLMGKAAMTYLSKHLAAEHVRDSIDVMCVSPGATETDMFRESTLDKVQDVGRFIDSMPKRRLIQPRDIADTVIWLATSPAGRVLHGSVLDASMGLAVRPGLQTEASR